jgi:hypothetical protein
MAEFSITHMRQCNAWSKRSQGKTQEISYFVGSKRLEADEETIKQIMIKTCPHTYPKKRIEKLKKQYKQFMG